MFPTGGAFRVFFRIEGGKFFDFDFFYVQGPGVHAPEKHDPVPGKQFPYKRPEVLGRFEGRTVKFGSRFVPEREDYVPPVNCFRSCGYRALHPVRVHVPDFRNAPHRQDMHVSALVCPVHCKAFGGLSPDNGGGFCDRFRAFPSYPEEDRVRGVRHAYHKPVCLVQGVPGPRICLPVGFCQTFLFHGAGGPPLFPLPVSQVFIGVVPVFPV